MSKITNGKNFLVGVDMRTATGRRYRDLVRSYAAGLGPLDERAKSLVRNAAGIGVHLEQLQVEIINCGKVDTRLLVRLANAQSRALAALGALASKAEKARSEGPTLEQHLAAIVARRAERERLEAEAE
jgi:hypothetical protein